MGEGGRSVLLGIGLISAVVAVLAMLVPWARSGRTDRSSVDLLGTAGSLDLIEGLGRVVAVAAWAALPILVAAAVVAAAWHRPRLSAGFLVPMGPILVVGWWIVARTEIFSVRWGAPMSAVAGLTATAAGSLLLMMTPTADTAEGER